MSCEKHKKVIEKYDGTLEQLAEDLGDLHYETLAEFLVMFSKKISKDGHKDWDAGRPKLGVSLLNASVELKKSAQEIEKAWLISKPYMENK